MTDIESLKALLAIPLEQLTFEQAFDQLEQIVTALESDGYSLEEALTLYERGQSLAGFCADLLDQAELRVQKLTGEKLVDLQPPD